MDRTLINILTRVAGTGFVTLSLTLIVFLASCSKNPLPYDEYADAHLELRRALAQAQITGKPVLVVFGANTGAQTAVSLQSR